MSAYDVLAAGPQRDLLEQILQRCKSPASGRTAVIVFDLDGTLFDNRPRTVAILHELAERWATREPDAAARLRGASADKMAYLLAESLANVGVTRTELVAEAETFWRDRFFVDSHIKFDVALAGAVSFAKDCYAAGAFLVYFTGRDLPLMGAGTFSSLRDCGFPIGVVGTELVLKPDAAMPDEAFKRLVGPDLARLGEVVAVFDNEPANCNVLLAHFPSAESCLLDTQHVPDAPPPAPRVKVIANFSR